MKIKLKYLFTAAIISAALFFGGSPRQDISILIPCSADTVAYDQGKTFLVSVNKSIGNELVVSNQWESEKLIDINTKATKDNFAKEFYKIFAPKTMIELLAYSYKFYSGMSKPDSILFTYSDTMTLRSFWQTTKFAEFLKEIQSINASSVLIYVRGWKDSVYTTTYEDPISEGNALYKVHLQFIPNNNRIYFYSPGKFESAVEYVTRFAAESSPLESRNNKFHNSKLEENCSPCHDGLPSADGGKTMKADCGVCHKAVTGGKLVHGPTADAKECTTCHSWSSEKNSMIVTKGVPNACYDCHDEKKKEVENSATPHPISSDCMTCHSPHSTNQQAILKKDVYRLCLNCHDGHKANHPVDKHPLRFAKISGQNNEEISCASCHKPHGSENAALLKASGGSMAICMQCHQK